MLGVSVATHGEVIPDTWAWYSKDSTISRPLGRIPESDCLEMMCEYGCVEKNNLIGYCCPGNGQCEVDGANVDVCCEEDEFCDNGTCQKKECTFNGETYQHNDPVLDCGKCVNGSVIQDTTKTLPDCKTSCNTATWNWNNVADGTKIGDCQECQSGEKVNVPDDTPVDDCHACQGGVVVNANHGMLVDNGCYTCKNGRKEYAPNGTHPDDCHYCNNGQVYPLTFLPGASDCWGCTNGEKVNRPDGTKLGGCSECQNGEKVNSPDGTAVGDCKVCKGGVMTNTNEGKLLGNGCYECKNGEKKPRPDGTTVGDCGKCKWERHYGTGTAYAFNLNGTNAKDGAGYYYTAEVYQDTSKTAPVCKSTCDTSTWLWNNQPDGTQVDDCNVCTNGKMVNVSDGTKIGSCQECQSGVKVNVADGTPIDECHICTNGESVLDEEKCPEGCPPGVDVEYASKVSNPLSICGSRCTKLVKKGCCPLDKPKFNWVTYTCEKSCTVDGKVYAEGKMFVGGGTEGAVDPCKICKDNKFVPLEDGKTSFRCTWCKNGEMVELAICGQFNCCKEGEMCYRKTMTHEPISNLNLGIGICHEPCSEGTTLGLNWDNLKYECRANSLLNIATALCPEGTRLKQREGFTPDFECVKEW